MRTEDKGYKIEFAIGDDSGEENGIRRAAQFCAELVKQGVLFDAVECRGTYGERTLLVLPTGGY